MTEQDLLLDCLRRLNRTGGRVPPHRIDGEQLLGHPAHDARPGLRRRARGTGRAGSRPVLRADFYLEESAVRDALDPPRQLSAIDLRSALKVDFWVLRRAPFGQEIFRRRVSIVLLGEPAWIATAEDVILHKLYWNAITPSDRQIGDAAGVVAVQGSALDRAHLRRWAGDVGVSAALEDLLSGRTRPKLT